MNYVRRPNPKNTWALRTMPGYHAGDGMLVVHPSLHVLPCELTTRPGERFVFSLTTDDEETLRRLLNERHRAREVEKEDAIPELHREIAKLRAHLNKARDELEAARAERQEPAPPAEGDKEGKS